VSYDRKHNEANGEGNRDGAEDNRSWNCGVEGETDGVEVKDLRQQQLRNLIGTLLLSVGVPMLVAGDELGRTQRGNNNAYCQDNDVSWLDWSQAERYGALTEFTRKALQLRRDHPVLRQRHFFDGRAVRDGGRKDVAWFGPDGREMTDAAWFDPHRDTIGVFLAGDTIRARGPRGEHIDDDSFLLLLHSGAHAADFVLPDAQWSPAYVVDLHTARDLAPDTKHEAASSVTLEPRSLVLLRATGTS
jgi:glycogen operon protein